MDQEKIKITKQMLPFLMKPMTLIVMIVTCIFGEVMWMYRAIQMERQWESLVIFIVGIILGFTGGKWTSEMFNKYYVQSILRRVNILKTSMGKRNTIYIVLALGVPMVMSFIPDYQAPFLPVIQSYIFGFICGMNLAIYLWARRLPAR